MINDEDSLQAPLSLDNELRLHPQRLELGKAELLTDAITLPFTDIESRLNRYAINSSPDEQKQLRSSMKSYLGRLNSNPLIPLNFRLKVLQRFEQEINLFDAEMTAAVLNAHKIAIELVQKEARNNPRYYAPLVEMIANAVELALKILQLTLAQYRATPVIATRQFFELARLGLDVAESLDETLASNAERLVLAIAQHELLRAIDLYSKTPEQQQLVLRELAFHLPALQAKLCHKQKAVSRLDGPFLLTNMSRPNDPPALMQQLQGSLPFDAIVLPVSELIKRLTTAVEHVQSLQANRDRQKSELHTEDAMQTTLIGGGAILQALNNRTERVEREAKPTNRLQLQWDCAKAFIESGRGRQESGEVDASKAWSIINLGSSGACIESLHECGEADIVGSMLGLQWPPASERPVLGFVRWMKLGRGGQQLGIEFFKQPVKLLHASIESGSEEMNNKRSWPVLIQPGKGSLTVWFPEHRIYRNMVFAINSKDEKLYFKVLEVSEQGPNYSRCEVARARIR